MLILVPAGPLGLLEEDSPGTPLTSMLQALNRFLLERIAQDFRSMPPHASTLDQVCYPADFSFYVSLFHNLGELQNIAIVPADLQRFSELPPSLLLDVPTVAASTLVQEQRS